ncbi:MAG TPA: hypothetical protein VGF48_05760 [Thermoanaerobaculia bacterium]|jgi:hypothetical protein
MPKYRIDLQDTYVYSVIVEADNLDDAEDFAWNAVHDGDVKSLDGHGELSAWQELPAATPGPFPRSTDTN